MTGKRDFGLLDVKLLGSLDVRYEDRPVDIPGGQPEKMVAKLSLNPDERFTAGAFATMLKTSRGTVHNGTSSLCGTLDKQGFGGLITRTGAGYRMHIKPDQVDANRFKQQVRQGRDALAEDNLTIAWKYLDRALSLWRGDEPLAGLLCPGLADTIADLKKRRVSASKDWCDIGLRLGRHQEALPVLEVLARAERLNESVHELYIIALYDVNGKNTALDAYEAFAKRLAKKGLEARASVRDLRRQMDADSATLALARWRRRGGAA